MASFSPPSVPYGADETVFVVIENAGAPENVEREVECADLEMVVTDLLAGQFADHDTGQDGICLPWNKSAGPDLIPAG